MGSASWHFTYDGHLLRTMRRPNQAGAVAPKVTENIYEPNGSGRVTAQIDELNRRTDIEYTSIPNATNATKVTGPVPGPGLDRNVTVETYQSLVRTSITRGYGTAEASIWTFDTDPYTLGVTKATDPNHQVTSAVYDRNGNMTSHTDALLHTTSATYNAFDEPVTVTDAKQVTTTYEYDNGTLTRGNLTKVSRPLLDTAGAVIARQETIYHRDDPAHPGDVTSITDPRQKTWLRTYDAFGDLVTTTDPLGDLTKYRYDTTTGWLTSTLSPRGVAANLNLPCTPPAMGCTVLGHDAWGHVNAVTDANGHQSTTHYDADGNVNHTVDADSNPTDYVYDDADQQTLVHRAGGTTTATEYRGDGLVKSTSDGAQALTAYGYDHQGRLRTVTDPDLRVTSYGYDPAGHPLTKADPGGTCPTWPLPSPLGLASPDRCTVMQYYADDRLQSVTYSDGVTPKVTYGYDNIGQRTSMTDGTGASSWTFDSLHRLTQTTDGSNHSVSYGYILPNTTSTPDLRDPATAITYGPSQTVKRDFDDAGRMTSTTDWMGKLTAFRPDADSNLDQVTFPAGTGLVDEYGFDNVGALSTVKDKSGATERSTLTYQRDNASQVSSVASTGAPAEAHSYTYTPLNQLQNVDAAAYAYDNADNLKTLASGKTQAFDAANQLCWTATGSGTCATPPAGATTYSYDSRGNRTATVPANQAGTGFQWDQANRLIGVTSGGNGGEYTALTPARILDTRAPLRTGECPGTTCATLAPGQILTLKVAGHGGVPATGAAAVALSVVVTQPTAAGWLTVWPSDAPWPGTSNLNWTANQTVSNLALVKLAPDGTVNIYNPAGSTEVVIDVSGWFAASDGASGSGYNSLNATRVLDTRAGVNAGTCPPASCATIGAGSTLKLKVTGANGVPDSGVSAVAINLTAVSATAPTWLTVWSSDEPRPATASMNVNTNLTAAELVIAKVARDGTVSIFNAAGTLDVIGDLAGWYAEGPTTSFGPLNGARILDTRAGVNAGSCTGTCQTIASGGTLVVHVGGQGGVPAGASAAAVNVTALGGTGGGYLTLWPSDVARPTAAQLSYAGGQIVGAAAIVKLAADGTMSIYAAVGPVDVIVDVQGYYAPVQQTASYTYNGDGLRMSKTVAGTTTRFTWADAGGLPVVLNDGTNSYLYGPDGLPVEHIANGETTWYHHDQLGSTRSLTNASGAVVATATYDAYGNLVASTGTLSPMGFSGEYTDAETGFTYLRARYYDPATGQFLSRDRLVAITGSAYGYTDGNPLNAVDPSGENPLLVGALIGGGIDLGVQLFTGWAKGCGLSFNNVNWSHVAEAALVGAALGGLGTWAKGRAIANEVGAIRLGRAPEFLRGELTENQALPAALRWLGPDGYSEVSSGRYVSRDGLRGIRYGTHEVSAPTHHIHFETYEAGRVILNAVARII